MNYRAYVLSLDSADGEKGNVNMVPNAFEQLHPSGNGVGMGGCGENGSDYQNVRAVRYGLLRSLDAMHRLSQQQPSSKRFGSLVGRVPRGRMPGVWGGTAVTISGPSVSNWTVTIPTLATTFRAPTAIYPMALRCLSRLGLCGVCPSTGSTGPHTTKTPSPSP